ncbi:MAG TPA: hypothetical protein PKI01_01710 [Bacteroidales bacterium]|nr:hypothetical protein [Bacteroidales bacterium]
MKYSRNDYGSKIKKYILISVAVIVFGVALFFGYSYLKRLKDPVIPAIKAIPESTVCLIEFKNILSLWDRVSEKNQVWKELQCLNFVQTLNSKIRLVDSLAKKNEDIANVLSKNPLYLAWVPDRADYRYLFTINLNGPHQEKLVDDFMHEHFSAGNTFSAHQFLENEIFEIHKAGKLLCAYTVYKGIFIIAETSSVVESSLSALLIKISIENDPDFMKLNSSAGKNVDANIFIKISYIDNLISGFFSGNRSNNMKILSLSGDLVSFDLTIKNDELLFAGFALSNDPGQLLNKIFRNQTPQKIELTGICPSNTALMAFWGAKNTWTYVQNYTDFMNINFHKRSFTDLCSFYDSIYDINISENFLQQIGNQFALVVTENPNIENPYRYYGVFRAGNITDFQTALKDISTAPKEQSLALRDSFAIRKLIPNNFLKDFFGNMFDHLDTTYYTTIKDYIVIGDSPLSLDLFISGYLSGKTLEKNPNYISFSDNVSDEANFCMYTNIRRSFALGLPLFNRSLNDAFRINETSLKNFQALAFQLEADKNKFYLNAYVKHNSAYIEENPAVWEFRADTTIGGKISVITDPRDNTKKILFFDVSDNLYLLGRNGQLIWKRHIKEPALSNVFITNLKNNKYYLVFNTKNHLYIFDLNGKMPDFSPVLLPFPTNTAITLIDYQKKNDYRIIIPCNNQKIYNYLITGKPTPGWNNFHAEALLSSPVEYFRFRDNDMMIASDKNGKVNFINRKGKLFIKNTQPFIKAKNSRFFIYTDQKKQYLLTSDRQGKLVFISENGKIDVVTLKLFSENHYFLTGDFNQDKKNDFIFFDEGKVFVFSHDKKKIFEADLKGQPAARPVYIKTSTDKFQIIFPNTDCSYLIFMNNEGFREYKDYTLTNPNFEINTLFGTNYNSILVSDSSMLLNYIID